MGGLECLVRTELDTCHPGMHPELLRTGRKALCYSFNP